MKMHLFLIEDDPQQSITIERAIKRRFAEVEVRIFETESDFCYELEMYSKWKVLPDLVICDVMLPWAFPSPNAPAAPYDVTAGTFRKAGLRCWKRFRRQTNLKCIPWIYFTALDEVTMDLPSFSDNRTVYVQKSGSVQPLLDAVEQLMKFNRSKRAESPP